MMARVRDLTPLKFDEPYIAKHFWPCAACRVVPRVLTVDVVVDLVLGPGLGILALLWVQSVVVPYILEPVEVLLFGDAVDRTNDTRKRTGAVGATRSLAASAVEFRLLDRRLSRGKRMMRERCESVLS